MKPIPIITLLLLAALAFFASPSRADRTVFQSDFASSTALTGWQKVGLGDVEIGPGYHGSAGLSIEQPASLGSGTTCAQYTLPLDEVRGKRLHVHAMVRARDVTNPPETWNGVKLMLVIVSPAGTDYPARDHLKGTFDWTPEQFSATVPENATDVHLVVGIEATTGLAEYDDIAITATAAPMPFSTPPAPASRIPDSRHPGIAHLRGAMVSTDVSPADLDVLGGQWGANLIRFQISDLSPMPPWAHPDGSVDLDAYDLWLRGRLDHLDSILPECKRNGIKVVVDLHTPPGGEIADQPDWSLFQQKRLQDRFLAVWDKIAHRYKDSDVVWGYDVCNEPRDDDAAPGLMDWQHLAERSARLIRSIDPRHAIIIESINGDVRTLAFLKPIAVPGVVYSVHMYAPTAFTFQGLDMPQPPVDYPGTIDGKQWNRDQMAAYLADVVKFQHRYHVPIYIGEFSAIRWAPGLSGERYLNDAIGIFEQNGWDWSYHAFREWQGWSPEYGTDRNATAPETAETPREELLRSWYAKNQELPGR
jgi:hypothetical protein